ncbi:MAG: hypothetical protein HOB84_09920 [Candidatus Marinimicrobia bacterium]|jgi:hypothetical protein|nr:hypothetical protein [Candidatus Neomarinimicrobiota bacterium]MBT4360820.1 hypothetical protein [Candidatus Neomarinimicrobiota bacterium]MBT4715078.1 hypothetical protein [Candidatus Neomarinimicrobiota bacterium]MBT4945787.1 hypothetical protein [Candidatus Neomarinimicrobiota bacterium]MBT5271088.1 hypothetical protein [Candidatus Neomarinimicrobiota bacterium]
MDKTEKFIRDELSNDEEEIQFDMDTIIVGTHSRIKKRASRRKALYSSPIAILLVMMGVMLFPGNDESSTIPGDELFIAGWEYSWTETENLDIEDTEEGVFYNQTVDYLIDDNYFTYSEDAEVFLDESDLEALMGYLKEA